MLISNWMDYRKLGVEPLTGEACAFSRRVLCDVSEDGAALIKDYLGLPADAALAPKWNSQVGSKPAVGSVMLSRDTMQDLAVFALLRNGALAVLVGPHAVQGLFEADLLARYEALLRDDASVTYSLIRNIRSPAAAIGSRNVHQATGRVE